MSLNRKPERLADINWHAAQQHIELAAGIATSKIRCRLSGTILTTGANADGVVFDDPLQRLITSIRIERDSDPIIRDIPLRDLYQIFLRQIEDEPTNLIPVDASVQGEATSFPFELHFEIPFSSGWLGRPWDTHLPPLFVRQHLRLYVTWSQAIATAGDDPGTGAIVKSSTDAYTFSVPPKLEITQITHPRAGEAPFAVRHFSQFVSQTWTAATAKMIERIQSDRQFDFHLFRQTYGANDELQNSILTLGLRATGDDWIDDETIAMLHAEEASIFPVPNEELGYLGILYADGGRLTNAVMPRQHADLRYEFGLAAPTSGDGLITITSAELVRNIG